MSISLQHSKILVTGNSGYFHDIQSQLEEPAAGFMYEIVEVKITDISKSDSRICMPLSYHLQFKYHWEEYAVDQDTEQTHHVTYARSA